MIVSLPNETVVEAKRKARRTAWAMFFVLLAVYAIFFNLGLVVVGVFAAFFTRSPQVIVAFFEQFRYVNLVGLGIGAVVAIAHFIAARLRPLERLVSRLGAVPVDINDVYHRRFANIVREAEVATGVRPILPLVIPSTGANACAVASGRGGAAICATEGLLARLTRPELAAVVAHEAARIVNDDAFLMTTACSLVNVFDRVSDWCTRSTAEGPTTTGGGADLDPLAGCLLWPVSTLGHAMLSLVYMAISRDRGYLADAHAVEMCKDPLALAEAIHKISRGYRGCSDLRSGYEALFIVDPRPHAPAEGEGPLTTIFSTHPPTMRRLERLVAWAKADVSALKSSRERSADSAAPAPAPAPAKGARAEGDPGGEGKERGPEFLVNRDGEWEGPYVAAQLLAMKLLKPATWVALASTCEIMRASDSPLLLPLFDLGSLKSVSGRRCPRCKVSLVNKEYEGAPVLECAFCDGHLLKRGVLERLIARRDKRFTAAQLEDAKAWRATRRGRVRDACGFPEIKCPLCGSDMRKQYHSVLTKVVVDVCTDRDCLAVWCDGGELARIQLIVEDAARTSR